MRYLSSKKTARKISKPLSSISKSFILSCQDSSIKHNVYAIPKEIDDLQ